MPMTASQLKRKNTPFTISIGPEQDLEVRRPDIRLLIYHNIIPLPLLSKVGKMLESWIGQRLDALPDDSRNDGPEALALLDLLLCKTMVSPRCVATDEEREALPAEERINTIVPSDLDVDTRERIVVLALTTSPNTPEEKERVAAVAALSTFSGDGSGEGSPQDVPSLRDEAVVGVGG